MRTNGYFDQLPFVTWAEPPKLELDKAVIFASRIYARAKLVDPNLVYPEVASFVIAYQQRRLLAVYNGASRCNKFVCSGLKDFSVYLVHSEKMREELLQYIESNNVLISFHLNWLLTAVELTVSAAKMVDLGLEPAFLLRSLLYSTDYSIVFSSRTSV